MKKKYKVIILTLFLLIIIYILAKTIEPIKMKKYTIKENKKVYTIEQRQNKNNKYKYDIVVKDYKNNYYTFEHQTKKLEQNKNKTIKQIKYYKENDLKCILPLYNKNKIDDLYCIKDKEQVTYEFLKQKNNKDIEKIVNKIRKKYNKDFKKEEHNNKTIKLSKSNKKIEIFKENIPNNYTFIIWRYKGLYILRNNEQIINDFLRHEQYENKNGKLVGKYFIIPESEKNYKIEKFIILNTESNKIKNLKLKKPISSNFYINGVYDNKLYITDIENKKEYKIDPYKNKINTIGEIEKDFIIIKNNKETIMETKDFLAKNIYFDSLERKEKTIKIKEKIYEVKETNDCYYYKIENRIYKSYKGRETLQILLFEIPNIIEWNVKNDDLTCITDDTLYLYNEKLGLLPIVINKEFKYNHKNIYDFIKK